jgi:choline dehydrogenase
MTETSRADLAAAGREEFDFVIAGAGSAGAILAARLSECGRYTVALVEAGGEDRSFWLKIPVGYAKSYYNPAVNWMYRSEPEAALGNRQVYVPRGKVLGGSGAINAMIFVRGAREDFDDWRAAGNPGWGHDDVLPYFRKLETHALGESPFHGGDGPIHVTPMRGETHPTADRFLSACAELQLPATPDFNGASLEGAGIYDVNTRAGMRSSSGVEYLKPARRRKNLTVFTRTRALEVVLDAEGRARGLVVRSDGAGHDETGQRLLLARRDVILATGAIATPVLLQRSGLGAAARLQALGVPVRRDLPGVGANLQDHLCASFYFRSRVPTLNGPFGSIFGQAALALRWALTRKGPFAGSVNQAGGFFRSRPDAPRPNLQLYFNPLSYRIPEDPKKGLAPEPYPGFLVAFNSCRPTSRGRVDLRINGGLDDLSPMIQGNYLSTEEDCREAVEGSQFVRRLMQAPSLAAITEAEMSPSVEARSDQELLEHFRANCGSIYHPCGTAAMGPDPSSAVVDHRLRVHGVPGLRVVDASVFPNITSGNINAPVMMVAEKGADMILEDARA